MAKKTKAKRTGALFPPVSKNHGKLPKETVNHKREIFPKTEMGDLRLSNIYIKPIPLVSFRLKVKIKAISQGQTQLFPSEFE